MKWLDKLLFLRTEDAEKQAPDIVVEALKREGLRLRDEILDFKEPEGFKDAFDNELILVEDSEVVNLVEIRTSAHAMGIIMATTAALKARVHQALKNVSEEWQLFRLTVDWENEIRVGRFVARMHFKSRRPIRILT